MARISDRLLIQQSDGEVVLFEEDSEEEFVRFNPAYAPQVMLAIDKIRRDNRLDEESKFRAVFWAGYFYAHATK